MKTAVLIACSGFILFTGCASVHYVGANDNEVWIQEARDDLLNKEATVTTWQLRELDGKIVRLNSDSLLMQEEDSEVVLALPLHEVYTIRPSRNVVPPLAGFVGGFIVGAVIGEGIGNALVRHMPGQDMAPIAGMVYGAILGSVAGSVILGLATSVTDYQFTDDSAQKTPGTSKPTPPNPTLQAK